MLTSKQNKFIERAKNSLRANVSKYKNEIIVIKYGGNVLIDRNVFNNFIEDIFILNKFILQIILIDFRLISKEELNIFYLMLTLICHLKR